MYEKLPNPELTSYHVQIGFTTVTVKGQTREDALKEARRQLCLDMPRMWDVIQKLDDSRFVVAALR
jgi:hypothetical protein